MALDIAMGGSTNTILHLLAAAHEARVGFGLKEIDELSRRVPCLCKVAPSSSYHVEDVHRAGGIPAILGELDRAGLLNQGVHTVHSPSLRAFLDQWDIRSRGGVARGARAVPRRAGRGPHHQAVLAERPLGGAGRGPGGRLHPGPAARLQRRRRPGRALRQPGARGGDREDRRGAGGAVAVRRAGPGVREPGGRGRRHPGRPGHRGRRGGHPVRGAQGRPGHAGDALPDQLPQGPGPGPGLRADHRRPVLRRHLGAVHLPRRAGGGRRRR